MVLSLTDCWLFHKKPETELKKSDGIWPLNKRKPYINENIVIVFKSGNRRYGVLAPYDDPDSIYIIKSPDQGVYKLSEIKWIEWDLGPGKNEVIFP